MNKSSVLAFMLGLCSLLSSIQGHAGSRSDFWDEHAVLMIYSSTCPYCHKQAQVLAALKKDTSLPLMLYGVDDKPLAPFKNYQKADMGLLKSAFPDGKTHFPALFIVNRQNLNLYPLSKGFLGMRAFINRTSVLAKKIIAHEKEYSNA